MADIENTILNAKDKLPNVTPTPPSQPMPMEEIPQRALDSLEPRREIYVYGDSDEQSAQAASQLRGAGFENVSELRGGLAAWKANGGPTEGNAETGYDSSSAEYNVKARLDKHAEVSSKNL